MNRFSVFYTLLNTRRATGADGITAQMLKATGTSIAKSITMLLKTGIFPTVWKFARVVPIPKTGNPESPSNYRPIHQLSPYDKQTTGETCTQSSSSTP